MDITAAIARSTGVSVFAVLEERAENVIDMYQYIIEKAGEAEKPQKTPVKSAANDGFWDF